MPRLGLPAAGELRETCFSLLVLLLVLCAVFYIPRSAGVSNASTRHSQTSLQTCLEKRRPFEILTWRPRQGQGQRMGLQRPGVVAVRLLLAESELAASEGLTQA